MINIMNKEDRLILSLVLLVITIALIFLGSYGNHYELWFTPGAFISSVLTGIGALILCVTAADN